MPKTQRRWVKIYNFFLRRLFQALISIIFVSIITFLIINLTGDPVALMVGEDATVEQVEQIRQQMGLDRPLHIRYFDYVSSAIRGDFGLSYRHRQPVLGLIFSRFPATAILALSSLLFAGIVGVPFGIIAAVRRDTFLDYFAQFFSLIGQAIPSFWLGLMLMLLFGVILRWLPVSGAENWRYLILPSFSLSLISLALITRMVRSSVLEIMAQDFVRTARSKGLSETDVILKHVVKNAAIPVVTIIGLQFGSLMKGTVVIESIYAWPGIGRLLLNSIYGRDMPVVMAGLILIATLFVMINFFVDLIYGFIDPRIKYN